MSSPVCCSVFRSSSALNTEGIELSLVRGSPPSSLDFGCAISEVSKISETPIASICCGYITYPESAASSMSLCRRILCCFSLDSYMKDMKRASLIRFFKNLRESYGLISVAIALNAQAFDLESFYKDGGELSEGYRELLEREARIALNSKIPTLRASKTQSDWYKIQANCLSILRQSSHFSSLLSVEGLTEEDLSLLGRQCSYRGEYLSLCSFSDWTNSKICATNLSIPYLISTLVNLSVNKGFCLCYLEPEEALHLVFMFLEICFLKCPGFPCQARALKITEVMALISFLLLLQGISILPGEYHHVNEKTSNQDAELIKQLRLYLKRLSSKTGHSLLDSSSSASQYLLQQACSSDLIKKLTVIHKERGDMSILDQENMVLNRPGDVEATFSIGSSSSYSFPVSDLGRYSIFLGDDCVEIQMRETVV